MAEKLADTFMTKGILKICELNGKSYDENLIEYQNFIENSKEQMENKMIALNKLIEKYGG
jgi:roadblock/LC7 domain-containing protein